MTDQSSQEFDASRDMDSTLHPEEQVDQAVLPADESTAATPERVPDRSPDRADEAVTESANAPAGRVTTTPAPSTTVLAVGSGIEVNGLQSQQVSVLQEQHAQGLIEVQRKASELKVDIQALDQTLESLTSQARTANDAGVNITATHTQNTTLGQTEIIVGNTQRAAAGKVAPLWNGFDNNQVRSGLIVAGAVIVGGLLATLLF